MIELRALEQVYPDGTQALRPITLSVQRGEFLSLLGPSGCGKSTLLKMMAGLLRPSGGSVLLNGLDPMLPPARRGLSFVFQEPTLMPWASVLHNVRLPLDLAHVPRPQADLRAREALHRVGLEGIEDRLPKALSGGMQMRVSIARALVTQPQVLLMDEPFGALDEITRERLDGELLALWKAQQLTVVFVTHSIAEAVYLSTRVALLAARPGRVVHERVLNHPFPRSELFRNEPEVLAHTTALHHLLRQHSPDDSLPTRAVAP